jgi:hypothetical protein
MKHRAEVPASERDQPLQSYFCNFADQGYWHGAVIVDAHGPLHAMDVLSALNIDAGCEPVISEMPPVALPVPDAAKNRLLSLNDVGHFFGVGPDIRTQ